MRKVVVEPKKTKKDRIVYVRFPKEDLVKIDSFRKKAKLTTRAETIRMLAILAVENTKVKAG